MIKRNNFLLLVDSNALMHRAYHALPTSMKISSGEITNAVYGFTNALMRAIEEHRPSHIACCFDVSGGTFRNRLYSEYKANRKEMDQELADQIPRIYEVVEKLGIKIITKKDYEADDLIGTIAKKFESDASILILTGDKDTLQLVDDKVTVETFKQGVKEGMHYTPKSIMETYGITPSKFIFYKALRGDPSDNIPGVSGVGEVTGMNIVKNFDDIDALYSRLEVGENLKEKTITKLRDEKDMAYLSYKLATIDTNVPLDIKYEDLSWGNIDFDDVTNLFNELEFHSLTKRLKNIFESTASDVKDIKAELIEVDEISLKELSKIKLKKCACSFQISDDKIIALYVADGSSKVKKVVIKDGIGVLDLLNKLSDNTYVYDLKSILKYSGDANVGNIQDLMLISQLLQDETLKPYAIKKDNSSDNYTMFANELFSLSDRLMSDLKKTGMDELWSKVEKPLIKVLLNMEKRGVLLNTEKLARLSKKMSTELNDLEHKIYHAAGERFNILSPTQLREILYEKLQISAAGVKKNKTGISTDAQTLEQLRGQNPIIDQVLRYRETSKLKSTYVDAFPLMVDGASRLHTTYNQLGAATGRISSEAPNLQNIPISSDDGNEIRSAFESKSGYKLISADYSQIELRILAHLSGDEAMIESFKKDIDIHLITASKIYDIDPRAVTVEQRRNAKTINFGLLYGLSAHSLSIQLNIDHAQAQSFIDKYFESYPRIKKYLDVVGKEASQKGYYTTMFGRVRMFPDINSKIWGVKASAERMARNFPMQGAQADILKMAMLRVEDFCNNFDDEVRMILTVHDEIVLEVKEELVDRVCASLPALMIGACKLDVPLKVGIKVGDNWRDVKDRG